MSLSHEQLTAESELRKTAQCMTSVIFSFFLSAGKEKKKVFDYIILTENGAFQFIWISVSEYQCNFPSNFSNEQLHVHFFFFFCRLIQVWEKILVEKAHMIHTCDSLLLMPNPSFNTRWVHVEFTLACILQIRCLTTPLNDLWILIKHMLFGGSEA